ncbi:MAG: hypothetical protein RBJ76_24585 [Stenomitos frigidus ULC029]
MLSRHIVQSKIASAFASDGVPTETARDIAFHMTDWLSDLEAMTKLWEQADQMSDDEIGELVYAFLCHVPEHVAAAAKLSDCGSIRDIFDVGVCNPDT